MRNGDFITTYSGAEFYIIDPRIEDIYGRDIAHALSHTCRANGHFKHFYSVAQHSINCALEAKARGYSKRVQLACLIHDGSEAYISDIVRPAKKYLLQYLEIEKNIQAKVYEKFGLIDLTEHELGYVSTIDDIVLWYEFENLHTMPMKGQRPKKFAEYDFSLRNTIEVKKEFYDLLTKLDIKYMI